MFTIYVTTASLLAVMLLGFIWRMAILRARRRPWWKKLFSPHAANGGSATIATVIEAALGAPGSARRSLIYTIAFLNAVYTPLSLLLRLRRSLTASLDEESRATPVYPLKRSDLRKGSMTIAEDVG